MKRTTLILTAIFSILFVSNGCMTVDYFEHIDTYRIDNQLSEPIFLYVESDPDNWWNFSTGSIPTGQLILPTSCINWIDRMPNLSDNLFEDENFTFILQFKNGVRHIFSEELIPNDFRDVNSWKIEHTNEHDGKVPHTIHTYTFTQEDYERIMALYE